MGDDTDRVLAKVMEDTLTSLQAQAAALSKDKAVLTAEVDTLNKKNAELTGQVTSNRWLWVSVGIFVLCVAVCGR